MTQVPPRFASGIGQKPSSSVDTEHKIPIAISGRHVHLNRQTLAALFGEGHKLTEHKPLSQPGQFACKEKVNLIGPKGRIDGVRVLGPLRSKNQIEVARTDAPQEAFRLQDVEGVGVVVDLAEGEKCQRCWKVLPEVGAHQQAEGTCDRCAAVVGG